MTVVRVNITVDAQALAEIDEAARKAGMNRSAYLQRKALDKLDGVPTGLHGVLPSGKRFWLRAEGAALSSPDLQWLSRAMKAAGS